MYFSKLFFAIGNSLVEIFGTVMLYKSGITIPTIILIFAIKFGIMGALSPSFLKLSSKFGTAYCVLIANIFRIIVSFMLLFGITENTILLMIVLAIPGVIYNPLQTSLSAKYIDDIYRGKYNSMISVFQILGMLISSILVTWGVVTDNTLTIFVFVSLAFLMEFILALKVNYKPKIKNQEKVADIFKYLIKSKNPLKIVNMFKTFHVLERFMLPLYVYLIVKDFRLFGSIIVITTLIQILTVIFTGRIADKNIKKANTLVSICKIIMTGLFVVMKNVIGISIVNIANGLFQRTYETAFHTSVHNITKNSKERKEMLATASEMWLCFTEVIAYLLLALLAIFINENIFFVIFGLSMIATIVINVVLNKNLNSSNNEAAI
ncbi:MAG: MFS transporter [Pseudomonadales bacterium]|nr:MFS transporter [Pseudomonadales bacterium]